MITVTQNPSKYTPSESDAIFVVTSDNADIVSFKVEIKENISNAVIAIDRITVVGDLASGKGSFINLKRILSNIVDWEVNNAKNVVSYSTTRCMDAYNIKFTETLLSNGLYTDGDTWENSIPYYVWNADPFGGFNANDYVNSVITTGRKFLTYKPNPSSVNEFSFEQLYFINGVDADLKAVVNTYANPSTLLNTYSEDLVNVLNNQVFRLQVSPKALMEALHVDFTNVAYYTVHIEKLGIKKSIVKRYNYVDFPCNLEFVNLLWVNSLGGIDSYQFINPIETVNYTKNTYKKNPYSIINGVYSDRTGDLYNADEAINDIDREPSYTATSRIISDAEAAWFDEMFNSKQAWVELNDGTLAPILITNNSYKINKQKYMKGEPNTIQVTYKITRDIILSSAVTVDTGSTSSNVDDSLLVQFIDDQMNTLTDFDTILDFTLSNTDAKEGVDGVVAAANAVTKFEFNKILFWTGLPMTMMIKVGGIDTMKIDFPSDYLGKECRFTEVNGTQHLGVFTSGDWNI